jgi:hypothetical protein
MVRLSAIVGFTVFGVIAVMAGLLRIADWANARLGTRALNWYQWIVRIIQEIAAALVLLTGILLMCVALVCFGVVGLCVGRAFDMPWDIVAIVFGVGWGSGTVGFMMIRDWINPRLAAWRRRR